MQATQSKSPNGNGQKDGQPQQKRNQQYFYDYGAQKYYLIEGNLGHQEEVDRSGLNLKTYHTGYTGVVKPGRRRHRALQIHDRAMSPEIHKKVKHDNALMPQLLEDANLAHYLPYRTPRQNLNKKLTAVSKDVVKDHMVSFNSPKYGLHVSEQGEHKMFDKGYKKIHGPLKNLYQTDRNSNSPMQYPSKAYERQFKAQSPLRGSFGKNFPGLNSSQISSGVIKPQTAPSQQSTINYDQDEKPRKLAPLTTTSPMKTDSKVKKAESTRASLSKDVLNKLQNTSHILVVPRDRSNWAAKRGSTSGADATLNNSTEVSGSHGKGYNSTLQSVSQKKKGGPKANLQVTRRITTGANSFGDEAMLMTATMQGFTIAHGPGQQNSQTQMGNSRNHSPAAGSRPQVFGYSSMKDQRLKHDMIAKFNTVKKNDIRDETIGQFFKTISDNCYNDWEENERKRQEKLAQPPPVDPKAKGGKDAAPASGGKGAKPDSAVVEEEEEPEVVEESEESLESVAPIPVRPRDRLAKLDHGMAETFFDQEFLVKHQSQWKNMLEDEELNYPFQGSKHLNPKGINREPVRMKKRLVQDQEPIDKLKDPTAPSRPTKTNYEAYLGAMRNRTKGRFATDPQRLAVVKAPPEHQLKDFKDIISLNPSMKAHLDRQLAIDDKQLNLKKEGKKNQDVETKIQQARAEEKINKEFKAMVKATWCKDTAKF